VTPEESVEIIRQARQRSRTHNSGRRHVEELLFTRLAATCRTEDSFTVIRDRIRQDPLVRDTLERMWPILTPTQLLNDLFGSRALLRLAGAQRLSEQETALLYRERSNFPDQPVFTKADVPLLDEALELLGPRPRHKEADSVRTYGHLVVDEAQDLSPMELRMLDRRSLSGSMTIVGDVAQATGAWPHESWDDVLDHLPIRRPPRRYELTTGYRLPGPIMDLAARVLRVAAPSLTPPTSIRHTGDEPILTGTTEFELHHAVVAAVRRETSEIGAGNVAVVVPASLVDFIDAALATAGIDHGRATRQGLDRQVMVVPVSLVKGLELDSVVVVEPERILREESRGAQSLYVALTRSTKRLTVVYSGELPSVLRP